MGVEERRLKLIQQGTIALESCNPNLAVQFFERALSLKPDDADTMDALSDALLQAGRSCEAKALLLESIRISPELNPAKYFYLAQLQESTDALTSYKAGISQLERLLHELESEEEKKKEKKKPNKEVNMKKKNKKKVGLIRQLSRAYSSVAELFLTDLCFEEDAERRCEEAVLESLSLYETNYDGQLTLCSLRLSQSRAEEASEVALRLVEQVMRSRLLLSQKSIVQELSRQSKEEEEEEEEEDNKEEEDHGMEEEEEASFDLCINLSKLLLECASSSSSSSSSSELSSKAADLLSDLLNDNDDVAEVWFLLGIASSASNENEAAIEQFTRAKDLLTFSLSEGKEGMEVQEEVCGEEEKEMLLTVASYLELLQSGQRLPLFGNNRNGNGMEGSVGDGCVPMDEEWSDEDDNNDDKAR